jgi:ribosomal protein S18 acetylase RimI-like enzyme
VSVTVSDPFAVRRARSEDLLAIARLADRLVRLHHERDPKRFFLPERSEEAYLWWFGRELERREAVVLVADAGSSVVGFCYGALEERNWNALLDAHGEIHDIFVSDAERRRGIGKALLQAMIAELEQLGAEIVVLATMVDNLGAQQLFASLGFRRTMLELTRDRGAGPR